MSPYSWHHGSISRERAEELLRGSPDGVFLVRDSATFLGEQILCVQYCGRVQHYRVRLVKNPVNNSLGFTIDDLDVFETVMDLIHNYHDGAQGLVTKLIRGLPRSSATCGKSNDELHTPFRKHLQNYQDCAKGLVTRLIHRLPRALHTNTKINYELQPSFSKYLEEEGITEDIESRKKVDIKERTEEEVEEGTEEQTNKRIEEGTAEMRDGTKEKTEEGKKEKTEEEIEVRSEDWSQEIFLMMQSKYQMDLTY